LKINYRRKIFQSDDLNPIKIESFEKKGIIRFGIADYRVWNKI